MKQSPLQNIVFDIGNVFVRWTPFDYLKASFPKEDPQAIWQTMRQAWLDLNRGKLSLEAAIDIFQKQTNLPADGFRCFCAHIMEDAHYLTDTVTLQKELKEAGYKLYYLSDNIREVIAYYQKTCSFMQGFAGGISSDEIGALKPEPEIYQSLLDRYQLPPSQCVFFDDISINVEGAQKIGMRAFVFSNAQTCRQDLQECGIVI